MLRVNVSACNQTRARLKGALSPWRSIGACSFALFPASRIDCASAWFSFPSRSSSLLSSHLSLRYPTRTNCAQQPHTSPKHSHQLVQSYEHPAPPSQFNGATKSKAAATVEQHSCHPITNTVDLSRSSPSTFATQLDSIRSHTCESSQTQTSRRGGHPDPHHPPHHHLPDRRGSTQRHSSVCSLTAELASRA